MLQPIPVPTSPLTRNTFRLNQIESSKRTTTPSVHHNCFTVPWEL